MTKSELAAVQDTCRRLNREGNERSLKHLLHVLGQDWDDDAAFVAFKQELARTKITRACRDLGPNFRGGWQ